MDSASFSGKPKTCAISSPRRVYVDPAVLPDQVIKDQGEFLVGSLGASFDDPVDQVIPLGSAAARDVICSRAWQVTQTLCRDSFTGGLASD